MDQLPTESLQTGFAAQFMNEAGVIDVGQVAAVFRMSKGQLAETTGLKSSPMARSQHLRTMRAQRRVTELLEIIARVRDWAGGEAQAMAWYRSQPIPALDGRTAEALVKDGKAAHVRDYLDSLALGGFA